MGTRDIVLAISYECNVWERSIIRLSVSRL